MNSISTSHKQKHLKQTRISNVIKIISKDKYLYLMFAPIFIYYLVFCYLPMPGVVIAFKNFTPGSGLYSGEWVGFKWFNQLFDSPFAFRLIRNTLLLAIYPMIFGFPVPVIFAVCLSEMRNIFIKRTVQTVSYLPHFISTVVIVGMLKNFLSLNDGIINNIVALFGGERINFMMDPGWFRTLYTASGVWQSFGFSSIIYIAVIVGIDQELYASAKIDGINKFQEVYYITIPMIIPTITILLLLQLGGIMSVGFEKVYLMYSGATYETADVISTYVYRKGIESSNYSFATAVGLFNSVVNFVLVFLANSLSKRVTKASLW